MSVDDLDIETGSEIGDFDYNNFSQYASAESASEAEVEVEEEIEYEIEEGEEGIESELEEAEEEIESEESEPLATEIVDLDSTAVTISGIALEPLSHPSEVLHFNSNGNGNGNGHAPTEMPAEEIESEIEDLEVEEEEVPDPRQNKTKVKAQSHPFSKVALVGGVGLLVIVGFGMFYSQLNASKSDSLTPVVATQPETDASPTAEGIDPETGRLKSELAFAEQTEANALHAQANQPTPTPSATPASPTPSASPAVVRSVPLPPTPPVVTPVTQPAPVMAPPMMSQAVQADPQEMLSPVEQWQQAASMGSFGRSTIAAPSAPVASAPVMSVAASPVAPVASAPVATSPASSSRPSISQLRSSSSTPGLRDRPMTSVLVGTQATGQLITAVVLAGDGTTPANGNDPNAIKYLIRLSQDLKDSSGATAIPSGAQLVVVVTNFSQQAGTVQLEARGVIADNREYTIPSGTLLIRGREGGILTADRRGGGNNIGRSILPSLFAGLGEAGRTLAQPSSTTTTNGGVTTTANSGDRNPGASFVSGAFGSLSTQIQQATQAANQSVSSRPTVWELESGETVQIFVNSTFEM